jgi:hypothetical protein
LSGNDNKILITKDSILKLEELFGIKIPFNSGSYSFKVKSVKSNSVLGIDIYPEENNENLISVYTENSHLQLQSCTGFIISNMLEEVIFISDLGDYISGLIISRQGDCSLYSNVKKSLLSKDFMELSSEKLLSAVALSVTEQSSEM